MPTLLTRMRLVIGAVALAFNTAQNWGDLSGLL